MWYAARHKVRRRCTSDWGSGNSAEVGRCCNWNQKANFKSGSVTLKPCTSIKLLTLSLSFLIYEVGKGFSASLTQMRINESMLKPGKPLCKRLVVLISRFLLPRSAQDFLLTATEDVSQPASISLDPKDWVQFSLLSTPGSAILRMGRRGGLEKAWNLWEQVPTHVTVCFVILI